MYIHTYICICIYTYTYLKTLTEIAPSGRRGFPSVVTITPGFCSAFSLDNNSPILRVKKRKYGLLQCVCCSLLQCVQVCCSVSSYDHT